MHLIDEEQRLGIDNLFDHLLQTFFKLAAVHGAGDEAAHVQHDQPAVEQRFRHVAVDDALGQPFHDGGLAHAGFTDERRIVLGAPAQDLNETFDLGLAPDHRVQFILFGRGSQIVAELIDQRRL